MPVLRTPDARFVDLPDYPFAPHYVTIDEGTDAPVRMHYVDEGAGPVILCLHGEPSWSYLYRKMIPPLVAAGYRVVAPDWIGFGRSDKYAAMADYSFAMHQQALTTFLARLDLTDVTLVCQDWGGLLGLTVAASDADRFARLVIMNTFLPTGQEEIPTAFKAWRRFAERTPDMIASEIIQRATTTALSPAVLAAYDAPFPDQRFKAGVQAFPLLVPMSLADPGAAEMAEARQRFREWHRPVLVMFSDRDPITRGGDRFFRALIPGAAGQPEITIAAAGHFLQEDQGPLIADHIIDFLQQTSV